MKKLLFKLLWVFILVFSLTFGCLIALDNKQSNVKATDVTNPKIEILKNNVSYSDSIYIAYAVACEGFEINKNTINLLFWNTTQENYLKGTEDSLGTSKGKTNINGKQCLVFYSEGLAAKHMTDDLYSRAYVVVDGVEYYSEVVKFSVLEYVYKMKEEATLNPHQQRLFDTLLQYGGAAQDNFDYNTNKKADATYYKIAVNEGILPDGFKHGRYQLNEKVVIKPLSKPGQKFSHWLDQNGIIVSYDKEFEITVTDKNEYTAIYKDITNVSSQLKMEYEVTYDATVDDLDLPNAVNITIGEETYTHEIVWDLTTFMENKVGKQKLYASFVDETLYTEYNLTKEDIYVEVNVLPYTYELDQETGNFTLTGYYGTDELVEIPSIYKNTTVTKIATKAFNEVMTLKEVVIPTTIEEIGLGAFYYCDNIEKMTIPFTGRKLTDYLTNNYSHFGYIFGAVSYENQKDFVPLKLKSITLIEGSTIIGVGAFNGLSQVEEYNIPASLEYIYAYAFKDCTSLTSFYINENLKAIGLDAFVGCTNLKRVDVDSMEVLFSIDCAQGWSGGSEFYTPLQNGADLYINGVLITEITLPSYAVRIKGLLVGCSSIEKIIIPNYITDISYAFSNMQNLKEVIFEEDSTLDRIGSYAFSGCISLSNIELPNSIITLGCGAFESCESIYTIDIPEGVTNIESYAFSNCINLNSITLPSSLNEIGLIAFERCSNLTSIEIPNNVSVIKYGTFMYCSNLISILLPSNLTTIEGNAFYGAGLTSIEIPSRVRTIDSNAFYACESLYTIYNNSELNLEIGSTDNGYLAYYAKEITDKDGNIYTNDGYTYVTNDDFVFEYYNEEYKLISYIGDKETATLPLDVNGNPYKIYNFKGLKNVIIPDGITVIDDDAFYECQTLSSITIPNSVISIGASAFESCINLLSITIPSSVTSIGADAFNDCECEIIWDNPTIENIGYCAFNGYKGKNIVIPQTVKTIDSYAFYNLYNVVNVYYLGTIESWNNIVFNTNTANPMCSAEHFFMKNTQNEWFELIEIKLPNTITSIGAYAFSGFENLDSITIPSSVTSIGSGAFNDCVCKIIWDNPTIETIGSSAFKSYKGTSITIPSSVTTINSYAFENATCEILWDNPTIETIGSSAFEYYRGTSITIPSSVTSIGSSAFSNVTCEILWDNPTIETIGSSAFANYKGNSITIPSSVTNIGSSAFYGCECEIIWDNPTIKTLGFGSFMGYIGKSIVIPSSVTTISSYAFSDCGNLQTIIIPISVTNIGGSVFKGCTNLTIYYEGTEIPTNWNSNWNPSNCSVVLGYKEEN
ncbi:MAG: leucine-rich repeat domain-containing protein [Erysipelotrichaceae bacterium]|nr:leucine-rich repeat domain-containing protein [Erysipelotrichaceae bacterium]